MPTGGVSRECRRLDPRRRGGNRRRLVARRCQGRRGAPLRRHHRRARAFVDAVWARLPFARLRGWWRRPCASAAHAPPQSTGSRLLQSPQLHATFGGGKPTSPSAWRSLDTSHYVTRLPVNAIGDAALGRCARKVCASITCSAAAIASGSTSRKPERASAPRWSVRSRALRDQRMAPGTVPWSQALAGAQRFHCTGITPALGTAAAAHARRCRRRGRASREPDLISDRNWSSAEAQRAMRPPAPNR
jgi:hypothetical protein